MISLSSLRTQGPQRERKALIAAPRTRVFSRVANAFCTNILRWLWVPAFAGTTQSMGPRTW